MWQGTTEPCAKYDFETRPDTLCSRAPQLCGLILQQPSSPMPSEALPATKILTFLSEAAKAGQPAAPQPFTKAEILAFPEVKQWLAKGYVLDSFENKLSPKDPGQVILLVLLARD